MCQVLSSELSATVDHHISWKVDNFASIRRSEAELEAKQTFLRIGTDFERQFEWCVSLCMSQEILRGSVVRLLDTHGLLVPFPAYSTVARPGMCIRLLKKPEGVDECHVSFHVRIKNRDDHGFYFDSKQCPNFDILKAEDLKWETTISPQSSQQLPLTNDGALVFEILISLHSPKYCLLGLDHCVKTFQVKFTDKLQFNMENMFSGNTVSPKADSPTKVISKDGVEFPVHRGILSTRSPVFLRMFQSDMIEGKTGIVRVKEISSEPLQVILRFLYTGQLSENWLSPGIVEELVYSAGKYELDDLLEFFDNVLGLVCTQENAGKLMNVATKLNLKKAEEELFKFIKRNATSFNQFQNFMEDAMCFDLGRMLMED